MKTIELSGDELDAVLAGLRLLQVNLLTMGDPIFDIATNCGEHDLITEHEIDQLCERINC